MNTCTTISALILGLGTSAGGTVHSLTAFSPGKEPCYPLNRRLAVPHSWYGHFGDEKNSLTPV